MQHPENPNRCPDPAAAEVLSILRRAHRQILSLFEDYDSALTTTQQQSLAADLCAQLSAHLALEAEVFYPTFARAADPGYLHEFAVHSHADLHKLIAQILASSPIDEAFDSRIRILGDVFAEHVEAAESARGLSSQAALSRIDFIRLAEQLSEQPRELAKR